MLKLKGRSKWRVIVAKNHLHQVHTQWQKHLSHFPKYVTCFEKLTPGAHTVAQTRQVTSQNMSHVLKNWSSGWDARLFLTKKVPQNLLIMVLAHWRERTIRQCLQISSSREGKCRLMSSPCLVLRLCLFMPCLPLSTNCGYSLSTYCCCFLSTYCCLWISQPSWISNSKNPQFLLLLLLVTKSVKWRCLGNQAWYHRSAGVKTTRKNSE